MNLKCYLRFGVALFFALVLLLALWILKPIRNKPAEQQKLDLSLGFYDSSGKYKIHSHVLVASQWGQLSQQPLCLAVQATLDHAFRLVEFVGSWPGAVSCALYSPGEEFSLTSTFLTYLQRCHPSIQRQVNFHLVYPKDRPPSGQIYVPDVFTSCKLSPEEVVQHLLRLRSNETIARREKVAYPQNVLRNVARSHCSNRWIMCPDIDMVLPRPSPWVNLPGELNRFLRRKAVRKCKNCAFVLPIYEINESARQLPRDKSELLAYSKAKTARPYHKQAFSLNQRSTNFSRWEKLAPREGVDVAYPVEKFIFHYEPVYIARRGSPPFDQRYVGYGMTRNTQAYEMLLADFNFLVLDNVFLSHWGFQLKRRDVSKTKFRQVQHNHRLFFSGHLRELAAKYDRDPIGLLKAHTSGKKAHRVLVQAAETLSQKSAGQIPAAAATAVNK